MVSQSYKGWSVVSASTMAFTVCFMVWMMFAVIGIPIKELLGLNEPSSASWWRCRCSPAR